MKGGFNGLLSIILKARLSIILPFFIHGPIRKTRISSLKFNRNLNKIQIYIATEAQYQRVWREETFNF